MIAKFTKTTGYVIIVMMAHERKRYLYNLFQNSMKLSPLVGVVGHRQVGKTTFIESNCGAYYVVDTKSESQEARADPYAYLKKRAGKATALDECQIVPELFPELKEWVRTHKTPGQFILSGSVRFTSREVIKESLTGRIINLELLPMTISEQEEIPLSDILIKFLKANNLTRFTADHPANAVRINVIHKRINQYFEQGGLPGVCFLRDQKQRNLKFNEQLKTILERDLHLVRKINVSYTDIYKLIIALADIQGIPIDYTQLRKQTGISTPTIKKLIDVFEAVFLIRRVSIEGSSQGFVLYFEDQGEHRHLCSKKPNRLNQLEHLCFTHLRAQFAYAIGEQVKAFQYRTRGGAYIPLAFRHQQGIVGILPIEKIDSISHHSGSIKSFLATYENSKMIVLHPGSKNEYEAVNGRVLLAPMGAVL